MGTKEKPGAFDCYENAEPDEPMFVLLARDRCAPDAVRVWADARERTLRLYASEDRVSGREVMDELDQIAEARLCAEQMETWRHQHRDGGDL